MKITNLEPTDHSNCSLQSLGRDFSLSIAKKAYYCIEHQEAFYITIPIMKGVTNGNTNTAAAPQH